ncbi:MAG TPA: TRAP transporter substrate-binding protein DctP [Hyphomicrobiales bacterium]|nr:TRAP transporter substrate-binding protein DctP [Rhodobiaceae bacterium]HXK54784.1 TRAP transporter substrate-binding protein DctP [Hyphomicrobiales bacterium]
MTKFTRIAAGAALAVAVLFSPQLRAEEVVISAASGFPKGTLFSKTFEGWVEMVNEKGKGLVRIDYKGGAPAIGSPFQLVKQLQEGVFNMVSTTGAYYTNTLPEADAFKLTELSVQELRKNGGFDYMAKLHEEKGVHYLGRHTDFVPFHLYLNKKIDKPDLTGLKIRVSPIYQNFFLALGATSAQRSTAPEVYSLLERGVVDGYGWPISGIFDFSWEKVTKYRVDPGFYSADIHILLNKEFWDKLSDEQKKFLNDMMIEQESHNSDVIAFNEAEAKRQAEAGIEVIKMADDNEKKWLDTAKEAGWEGVIKVSPQHGPELRKLFTKN